jgi:large subunit ribosomal protein L24
MALRKQSAKDKRLKLVSLPRVCKFKVNDKLRLMVGKNAGEAAIGDLMKIDSRRGRLLIKGVNMVTKHVRRDPNNPSTNTGIIKVEASVHVSNVALVCPKCLKTTKVGWQILENPIVTSKGRTYKKVRICRRCKERIDENLD